MWERWDKESKANKIKNRFSTSFEGTCNNQEEQRRRTQECSDGIKKAGREER